MDHGLESGRAADPLGLLELIAARAIPVTVWRVAGTGRACPQDLAVGLGPRAAALLVCFYTRPGDTVVDLTADPAVAGSAGAGARRYLPADHLADLADSMHAGGAARLVLLRWPSRGAPGEFGENESDAGLADLLGGCRLLLAVDGRVILALAPPPRIHYVDRARRLIPAAGRAGLPDHVIVVIAPIPGDPSPGQATPAGPAVLRPPTSRSRRTCSPSFSAAGHG